MSRKCKIGSQFDFLLLNSQYQYLVVLTILNRSNFRFPYWWLATWAATSTGRCAANAAAAAATPPPPPPSTTPFRSTAPISSSTRRWPSSAANTSVRPSSKPSTSASQVTPFVRTYSIEYENTVAPSKVFMRTNSLKTSILFTDSFHFILILISVRLQLLVSEKYLKDRLG